MPRTFVAITIPDDLKAKAFEFEAGLRDQLGDADSQAVKWVEEGNLHVTLKFLGEVADEKVGDVCGKIEEAVGTVQPFELEIAGVGAFPSKARPSVIWIGTLSGSEELKETSRLVEDSLEQIGFKREQKGFHGHITIGRVRRGVHGRQIAAGLAAADLGTLGSFCVDSVSVMKSDLRPSGPVYSVLKRIGFQSEESKESKEGTAKATP